MDSFGFHLYLIFSLIRLFLLVCSNVISNESPAQRTNRLTTRFWIGKMWRKNSTRNTHLLLPSLFEYTRVCTYSAYVRMYMPTQVNIHTYIGTYIHAQMRTYVHTYMHTYIQIYIRWYIEHTCLSTYVLAHICTYTYEHMYNEQNSLHFPTCGFCSSVTALAEI
jgi:hypothetical protein